MALTDTQTKTTITRSTRIKRNQSEAGTTAVSSMTEKSNAAGRRQPRALANNEKENIDPLTGLNSFQSSRMSKKKAALGASGKANATSKATTDEHSGVKARSGPATRSQSSPSAQNDSTSSIVRPRARKSTASPAKTTIAKNADPNGLQSFLDSLFSQHISGLEEKLEDTVSGRHLSIRQLETQADQYARELTVMPLADLSEAFNTSSTLAASTSHNAASSKQDHPVESTVHELDIDDLTATLRLLLASADDYVCLPAVLQTRGIKRTLDSNKPSGTSRASRRSSTGGSDCINPRPAKRIRKNSVPPPPPNSPLAFRALSLPLTSENVELLQTKDEEVEDYNTQDETQGSSHFSSVLGSLSDRAGVSFESLLLQETSFGSQLL